MPHTVTPDTNQHCFALSLCALFDDMTCLTQLACISTTYTTPGHLLSSAASVTCLWVRAETAKPAIAKKAHTYWFSLILRKWAFPMSPVQGVCTITAYMNMDQHWLAWICNSRDVFKFTSQTAGALRILHCNAGTTTFYVYIVGQQSCHNLPPVEETLLPPAYQQVTYSYLQIWVMIPTVFDLRILSGYMLL